MGLTVEKAGSCLMSFNLDCPIKSSKLLKISILDLSSDFPSFDLWFLQCSLTYLVSVSSNKEITFGGKFNFHYVFIFPVLFVLLNTVWAIDFFFSDSVNRYMLSPIKWFQVSVWGGELLELEEDCFD